VAVIDTPKGDSSWHQKVLLVPTCVNMARVASSDLVRPYSGVSPEDRVARRRAALIDAALRVFETEGLPGLSARRVSEEAGLTRRYFYESFEDIDALIGAVAQQITGEVEAAVRAAVVDTAAPLAQVVRQAVAGGLDVLTSVPVKGRFLSQAQSLGSIAPYRSAAMNQLAALVERALADQPGLVQRIGPRQGRVAAISAVGAILAVVDSWLGGEIELTRQELMDCCASATLGIVGGLLGQSP
jgi:AcrR family transcriptional regulator